MTIKYENQIWADLVNVVNQALAERKLTGFTVKHSDQPVKAKSNETAVILRKLTERPVGNPYHHDLTDDNGLLQHEETYLIEQTFGITAVKPRDPQNDTIATKTASDAVQAIAVWLMSVQGIWTLRELGYGVLPIKELRQTYIADVDGHYELTPNFDFTVCIKQSYRKPVAETKDKSFTIIPI